MRPRDSIISSGSVKDCGNVINCMRLKMIVPSMMDL